MTVISERLILASFASWAEDYEFLESIFKNRSDEKLKRNERDPPVSLFQSIEKENFERFKEKQRLLMDESSITQYSVIQTEHIRATIWKITEFKYNMRGYLTDLGWGEIFFDKVARMLSHNRALINADHKYGGSQAFGRRNNCIVKIDEMGLIEGTFYVCERNPRRKRQKVIQAFKRVLRNFDGPAEYLDRK